MILLPFRNTNTRRIGQPIRVPSGRQLRVVGALMLLVLSAGCSDGRPARYKVSGTVTVDGVPLECGFVRVIPEKARACSGRIGPGGKFTLTTFEADDGCVPGTHSLEVIALEVLGSDLHKWHAPKAYSNADTSELTISVTEPTDSAKIELTWDGGKPFIEDLRRWQSEPEMTEEAEGLD